jgi:hypothetical protein
VVGRFGTRATERSSLLPSRALPWSPLELGIPALGEAPPTARGCVARSELAARPEPSRSSHVDLRPPAAGARAPLPELAPKWSSPLRPPGAPAQGCRRSPTGSRLTAPQTDLTRSMPRSTGARSPHKPRLYGGGAPTGTRARTRR